MHKRLKHKNFTQVDGIEDIESEAESETENVEEINNGIKERKNKIQVKVRYIS